MKKNSSHFTVKNGHYEKIVKIISRVKRSEITSIYKKNKGLHILQIEINNNNRTNMKGTDELIIHNQKHKWKPAQLDKVHKNPQKRKKYKKPVILCATAL